MTIIKKVILKMFSFRKTLVFCTIAGGIALSCSTYEPPYYTAPEFVNFQDSSFHIREESGTGKIRVNIGGKLNPEQVTINYSVESNDNAVALYSIVNEGVLTIPPNGAFGEIQIFPINNTIADGQKVIELKIKSVTGNYVIGFPGPDALNSSIKVSIIDDDCPLDREFITGSIVETLDKIEEEGEEDDGKQFNNVSIIQDANDSKGIIISDFFGFGGSVLKVHLDPCTKEASIYDADNIYVDPENGPVSVEMPNGVGTFDQETKILTMDLQVNVQAGTYGTFKVVYKK